MEAGALLKTLADGLNKYMSKFGIDDPVKLAFLLSQVEVETADFKLLVEDANYSVAPAKVAKTLARIKKQWGKHFGIDTKHPDAPGTWTDEYIVACVSNPQNLLNYVYAGGENGDENSGR